MGRFADSVRRYMAESSAQRDLFVRKVIFDASATILRRSPVDTGRFRANWQYGFGVQPGGVLDAEDLSKDGSETARKIADQVAKGVGVHFIVNNLPYAEVIEYGKYPDPVEKGTYVKAGQTKYGITGPGYVQRSADGFSKQAPAGVLRITYEEIANDLAKHLREI